VPSALQEQVLQTSGASAGWPGVHFGQSFSVQLQVPLLPQVQLLQPSSATLVAPTAHGLYGHLVVSPHRVDAGVVPFGVHAVKSGQVEVCSQPQPQLLVNIVVFAGQP
jgi:hypothetical protein